MLLDLLHEKDPDPLLLLIYKKIYNANTKNIEHIKLKAALYYIKNKEKIITRVSIWSKENKEQKYLNNANYYKRLVEKDQEKKKYFKRREYITRIIRPIILNRDDYSCQLCKQKLNKTALVIHHIVPKIIKPALIEDYNNLITLCKPCHLIAHDGCYTKLNSVIAEQSS